MRIAQRISIIVAGVALFILLSFAGVVFAGSLDSPGAPGATSSYTLEDIYSRLNLGTAGTPGTFTEPAAGPTAGTMHTLNDIMGVAPVVDNANGASAGDVLAGKTFWGLTSSGWGPRTGTLATRTVSNATVSQAAGYYSAFNLSTVDTNLATANIKSGASIFGVAGKSTVVDTASGNASAGDLLFNKTAYVSTGGITGTMANNGAVTMTPGTTDQAIASGYHNGSGKVSGDLSLVTGNIKSGVSIFGVTGNVLQSTGTASAGDVLTGKTFSNSVASGLPGSMTSNGNGSTIVPGIADQILAAGYWSSANTVKGDTNLVAENIKYGASIFGVTGNLAGGVSCTCPGGKSPLGRWCDNGNGTVTDTTTGLVWLQDTNWGGYLPWRSPADYNDAHARAGTLSNGTAGLTDGSVVGDWRLPTQAELKKMISGTECISAISMYKFTGVHPNNYWSSTTVAGSSDYALNVNMGFWLEASDHKTTPCYVWPVRAGQ